MLSHCLTDVYLLCSQMWAIQLKKNVWFTFLHTIFKACNVYIYKTIPWYITNMWPPWVELFAGWKLHIILSKFSSLSKTTKLILLDSLLQEVCISSVFDGSLTLSSLGLSVCLSQSQTPFFRTKESPLTSLILTICGLQLVRNTLSAITNPLFWNLLWIWNINTFQSFFYALVCYICANLPYLNILCVVIGKKYIIFLW